MRKYLAVMLVVFCFLTIAFVHRANAQAQTGQGIMVNLSASGDFIIQETDVYKYNEVTAATFFSNTWNGSAPTVSCTGHCGTPPAAPGAPSPDVSQVNGQQQGAATKTNECTFASGCTLVGSTYTQSVKVVVGSGSTKGTYTFTYTYNVTPTTTNPVAPLTAWDLFQVNGGGGTIHVPVLAQIAGESVVKNSNPKIGTKYSFSETDAGVLSGTTVSRITNLVVSLNGLPVAYPTSTVNFPVDFLYATNAGSNGTIALLKDGNARTILNTDTFAGNDNGGSDGSALALATMDPVYFDLGPGNYTVSLTGIVKDNTGLASISFSVSGAIHIVTAGCPNPNN